jgi:Na+:H+ antiporter, NhaA family
VSAAMASLTPPVDPARDHIAGPESGTTLVEYGDFECPYCARAYPSVKQVQERLGDRLRFVFRELPLDKHPHARTAALAAEAAGAQGRFWEMHDRLFESGGRLEPDDIVAYARGVGLDLDRFARDMASPELADRVDEDFESAIASGVRGTPAFFIDGEPYDGAYDADSLAEAIEARA